MNEVTKIHLGRTAFAIAVDAQRELRSYLDTIKKYVSDESVVSEIELRMAELLGERGISGDKVILPGDVDFLKEQLGDPKDFADEDVGAITVNKPADTTKRLFRDTDNAMLAGVAAGLGKYFGVDVLLIRILFVIATFMGGWGILIYLILWLLVPEAKTPSDRLQMAGKVVNIDSLKEVIERADVKGAAQRANNSLAGPINTAFRIILKTIGVCFVVVGVALLLGLFAGAAYTFLHSGAIVQGGIFPVGLKEHLVVYIAMSAVGIMALFIVLFGMALFRRQWPIHGWLTGTLIGLMLLTIAVGSALTADVVPQVRDRYNANTHTTTYNTQPFTKVNLDDVNDEVQYQYSPTYSVSLRYLGRPDISSIKYSVSNGVLYVDSRHFDQRENCAGICLPSDFNMNIVISSPAPPTVIYPDVPDAPLPPDNSRILQS